MKTRDEICYNGCKGSLEWFLRRNFGLKGQYYSDAFEAVIAKAMAAKDDDEDNEIWDSWFCAPDYEPSMDHTKEAWDAWTRAYEMVGDLVEMGILDEETADKIREGFCDRA